MICNLKFFTQHEDTCSKCDKTGEEQCFITGCKYKGSFDNIGMAGCGQYTFPNGATYKGEFSDGLFHGRGSVEWSDGQRMDGVWSRGVSQERRFSYPDGTDGNVNDLKDYDSYAQRYKAGKRMEVNEEKYKFYNEETKTNEEYVHRIINLSDNQSIHVLLPECKKGKNKRGSFSSNETSSRRN